MSRSLAPALRTLQGRDGPVDVALRVLDLIARDRQHRDLVSLSRMTSAIAPSGVNTGWPGPELASPSLIFSFSVTFPPDDA